MSTLSEREHAHYAKELIKECGGPAEVERVTGLSAGTLSKYSNVGYDVTMPAKVINALEDYCKVKIYSRALFEAPDAATPKGAIDDTACDLTEAVARLQGDARTAMKDGRLTPRETEDLAKRLEAIKRYVDQAEGILRQHDAKNAQLRVVSQ